MNYLEKIKNKFESLLALALLISVTLIPAVNIPFIGKASYLSFSDYGVIIFLLLVAFTVISAIAQTNLHHKILKWIIIILWIFFLFELVSSLSNFKEFSGSYNIFDMLLLGAYTSILLFVVATIKTLKNKINTIEE